MPEARIIVVDPNRVTHLETGVDSAVYRDGERVIKVYHSTPRPAVIRAYQRLTSRAAELLTATPVQGVLYSNDMELPFVYQIHPIAETGITPSRKPVALSNFVPGPRLRDVLWYCETPQQKLDELPDHREASAIRSAIGQLKFAKVMPSLIECSHLLCDRLDVDGIDVVPGNVKVRFDQERERFRLIITDLASSLTYIKQLYSR